MTGSRGFQNAVVAIVFLCAAFAQPSALNPPPVGQTLTVEGLAGKTVTLFLADFASLPQHTFDVVDHGAPTKYEGVRLADVLAKTDMPLGDKFHSTAASFYLVVEAKDGYRAVYAWAELDPGFMDKGVYVVTRRDGKPLAEKDGPFQLVAPGEKRGGRWVRGVTALRLKQSKPGMP